MAVGGPDEAAQHYQQALELVVDPALAAQVERPHWCSRPPTPWWRPASRTGPPSWWRSTWPALPDTEPDEMRARLHAYVAHAASLYDSELDWRSHLTPRPRR